jgi:hypothetical protein
VYKGGGRKGGDGDGDGDANPVVEKLKYGHRMGVYYMLVFGSLLIALVIFKNKGLKKVFRKAVFKRQNIEDIGEDIGNDPKMKMKMWHYVLLFLAIFVAVFIGLWLIGAFLYILIGNITKDNSFQISKDVWKYIFINYDGIPIAMHFWLVFILVVLVLSVHYLGYAKFFSGWYDDMYFQDTGKKNEDDQLDSFIHYYALTILVMFTFFMILLCMNKMAIKNGSQLYAYYTMIMMLVYLALSVYILKQYKWGKNKKLAFIALLVFAVVFLYMFIITLIVTVTEGNGALKAMFGKGKKGRLFKDMIFRWGIDVSKVPTKKATEADA